MAMVITEFGIRACYIICGVWRRMKMVVGGFFYKKEKGTIQGAKI